MSSSQLTRIPASCREWTKAGANPGLLDVIAMFERSFSLHSRSLYTSSRRSVGAVRDVVPCGFLARATSRGRSPLVIVNGTVWDMEVVAACVRRLEPSARLLAGGSQL
jgi:hypothetical protein